MESPDPRPGYLVCEGCGKELKPAQEADIDGRIRMGTIVIFSYCVGCAPPHPNPRAPTWYGNYSTKRQRR